MKDCECRRHRDSVDEHKSQRDYRAWHVDRYDLECPSLNANTAATTTIGYKFAVGGDRSANLANTDLTSQVNAQNAVSVINAAITDVSSMDGYLGAQINTLNAISQVMSTQQEKYRFGAKRHSGH